MIREHRVSVVLPGQRGRTAQEGHREPVAGRDHVATPEHREQQVLRVRKGLEVHRDRQDRQDPRVRQVQPARLVPQDHRDHEGRRVPLALRVLVGQLAQQVHREAPPVPVVIPFGKSSSMPREGRSPSSPVLRNEIRSKP